MGTLEQISICKNEDRNSLDNLKNKLNKFANWYFTPKSFEKSGKLYEWGGGKIIW